MRKKKKKVAIVIHEKRDLDWFMKYFKPICSKCGEPMSAHAYRKKTKLKDEVVYTACDNKSCINYHFERRFVNGVEEQEERRYCDEIPGCPADVFYRRSDNNNPNLGDMKGG